MHFGSQWEKFVGENEFIEKIKCNAEADSCFIENQKDPTAGHGQVEAK